MANRIKLKGTSERSFDIGLGPKQTFDANGLTANRTWVLPDSNGTNGYVLSTDGSGNLSWAAQSGGTAQAQIAFTAASTGTNQTFSNANLASFTDGTYANLFVNGVLLQTSEYSITGTTATISTYLNSGDYIQVAATGAGGGGGGGVTSFSAGTTGFTPSTATTGAITLTGTLAIAHGGTGQTSFTSGYIRSNGTALSSTATIAGADVSGDISGNAANVTGTIAIANGGTNITTYATGDMLYASATNTLAKRTIGSTDSFLIVSGGVPTWSQNVKFKQYAETVVSGGSVSGTITPDAASGSIYTYTLTGSITLNAITNIAAGTNMVIILTQGGTGSYTLTSSWKYAGGSKTLSTAVGAIDIISVFYDGSTYYASLTTGYA